MEFTYSVEPLECNVLLQLNTVHLNFPLLGISLLNEKDVHLIGQNCPIQALRKSNAHTAEHL